MFRSLMYRPSPLAFCIRFVLAFGAMVQAQAVAAQVLPAQPTPSVREMVVIGRALYPIDAHEVTVGQFRAFVAATGSSTKAERDGGGFQFLGSWQRTPGWTWAKPYGAPARDDEPAVHITWEEAKAYCTWAGLRLPTDGEWTAAAYKELRETPPPPFASNTTYPFPTGDTPSGANQLASTLNFPLVVATPGVLGQGRGHAPVKSTRPGVNGLYDMGGNVWEWVDHDVGGQKRTRGGSWWYGPAQMRADALYEKAADFPAVYIGFRCAGSQQTQ